MENQYSLEVVRAWAEGRLEPELKQAFEAQLAIDAELRELAEAYREIHGMTEAESLALPTSRLEFADLERDLEIDPSQRPLPVARIVAIAAGVLALASLAWWWSGSQAAPRSAESVRLSTIPLSTKASFGEPDLPVTLASYRPVSNGRIQWVRESEEADRLASATGRPKLVFGRYSKCKVADGVEQTMSADTELQALAEQCVPVIMDLDEMDETERDQLVAEGYPSIQLKSADGSETICVTKESAGCDLNERIRKGIGSCGMSSNCPSWEDSRSLAALCSSARAAEAEGRMAEAHRAYEQLVASGGPGLLSEAGQRGLIRIALAARDSLLDARGLCAKDREEAERILAAAVDRFENTPHVAELALVLQTLRRTGEFPTLAWASN